MNNIETGGSAYPFTENNYIGDGMYEESINEGMTLRDYFAGQALTGLLANGELEKYRKEFNCGAEQECSIISEICGEYADAMIKERNNE